MLKKLIRVINNPTLIARRILSKTARLWPDRLYLKALYRLKMGVKLNLKTPKTFNEKLNWLKLYNRKSEYTQMVDKLAVKEYVTEKIGKEYIIPTLGAWNNFDEIDFSLLPDKFVLKTTNGGDGNGVVICTDKSKFDKEQVRLRLSKSLLSDIYTSYREWPYKDVKKKIFAEKYITDDAVGELRDYKFFCFNGNVQFCKADFGQFIEHHANYFDRDWNLQPFGELDLPPIPEVFIEKPEHFERMIEVAEKLSAGIPFVRIDLYNIKGKIYFGEITFFPAAGMGRFTQDEWDGILGNLIKLPGHA